MIAPPRFLVDEDFDNDILRGVLRKMPHMDVVRVQDVGLSGRDDPDVLEWAADAGRAVLTHDIRTMKRHAYARVTAGERMPGLFAVSQSMAIGQAIEKILLIAECSRGEEWEGQVRHLPL
jgi:hypothetical protein